MYIYMCVCVCVCGGGLCCVNTIQQSNNIYIYIARAHLTCSLSFMLLDIKVLFSYHPTPSLDTDLHSPLTETLSSSTVSQITTQHTLEYRCQVRKKRGKQPTVAITPYNPPFSPTPSFLQSRLGAAYNDHPTPYHVTFAMPACRPTPSFFGFFFTEWPWRYHAQYYIYLLSEGTSGYFFSWGRG